MPDGWDTAAGSPAMKGNVAFLMKDVVLLAVSVYFLKKDGRELTRYGLVVVVGWIGLMKFTTYEAEGIRPFVANNPLMSWVYGLMSVRGFSAVLGVIEVAIALLIAARPFWPRASALADGKFLTTLSFLVTTKAATIMTSRDFDGSDLRHCIQYRPE